MSDGKIRLECGEEVVITTGDERVIAMRWMRANIDDAPILQYATAHTEERYRFGECMSREQVTVWRDVETVFLPYA